MRDWITKLDGFLTISGRAVLDNAGGTSAERAKTRAELEYSRYKTLIDAQPRPVDAEFEKASKRLQKPRPQKPKSP